MFSHSNVRSGTGTSYAQIKKYTLIEYKSTRNKTKGIELTYFDLAPKRVSKILLIAEIVFCLTIIARLNETD